MLVTSLDEPLDAARFGAKAANLSTMRRAGIPVPRGVAIATEAFDARDDAAVRDRLGRELADAIARLETERVMVRSSAVGEDSDAASFAGQLESYLCVRTIDDVLAHVGRCWSSYASEGVAAYQRAKGVALRGMGVVVQELVDPDWAGVLFTRAVDDERTMLCEYAAGHAAALVAGEVDPIRLRIDRERRTAEAAAPFDVAGLQRLALRLEALFGAALDIEWVVRDGDVSIVQSRPITIAPRGREIRWSNTNVNENYPGPITPLLYSIAREAYYHYFRNLSRLLQVPESAVRELEPAYASIIGAFGCRMYYNMTSIHDVIARSPFAHLLRGAFDDFVGYTDGDAGTSSAGRSRSALRFIRSFVALNVRLERNVRAFEARADAFDRRATAARTHEELRACFHAFIEIRMHGWYRASLADFFAMVYHGVLGRLCRRLFGDDHQAIHNTLLQAIPGLVSGRPVAELWRIARTIRSDADALAAIRSLEPAATLARFATEERFAEIDRAIRAYLDAWGFRCSGELMLTEASYSDEPARLVELLRGYVESPGENPETIIAARARERVELVRGLRRRLARRRGALAPLALADMAILRLLVRLASSGISARERVRLKQALVYHRLKLVVGRIGEAFAARGVLDDAGDILFLRHQEIAEHLATSDPLHAGARDLVALRRIEFERASRARFPDEFGSRAGEYPTPESVTARRAATGGADAIGGLTACGGRVRGRVRVLVSVMEMDRLEPGDILVTRQTDPGWATVFPLIGGLIVERGGMLSHGAIVAREFGIPAIVGVAGATSIFADGEEIELNADRGEVYRNDPNALAVHTPAL